MPGEWTVITGSLSLLLWSMGTFSSSFLCFFDLTQLPLNWKSPWFRMKPCRFSCFFLFSFFFCLSWYILLLRWQKLACAEFLVTENFPSFQHEDNLLAKVGVLLISIFHAVFLSCHGIKPSSESVILWITIRKYIFDLSPPFCYHASKTLGISYVMGARNVYFVMLMIWPLDHI